MSKGKKTGGRDWKSGETGNPNGSPGLPKDLKDARKLNQVEFERAVNKCLYLTPTKLQEHLVVEDTPVIEHLIGSVILRGIKEGSHAHLEFVLNRLVGKVQDRIEVRMPEPYVVEKMDGTTVEMGAKPKETT